MKFSLCFVIAAVLVLAIFGVYLLFYWLENSAPVWLNFILGFFSFSFIIALLIWAYVNC